MVRINLLSVRVSKKKEAGKQQLALFAVVLAIGIAGNVVWSNSRGAELEAKQKKVAQTRADIAQLDKIIGEVTSLRTQQQQLQEKLDVLEKLKQGRSGPVRMLDDLATMMPKRLWLRKMDEKGGRVVFDGTAASIDDVSAFMGALKGSRFFTGVELKKTSAKADGNLQVVDFNVVAAARYTPDANPAGPGTATTAGR